MEKKIQQSIKLLQSFAAAANDTIELCYSGGKDSDVILQLAKIKHPCLSPYREKTFSLTTNIKPLKTTIMLKLQIIGNIGANAALKETPSGRFVSFNVAHTDKRTDTATGEQIERTTWVSCTINGDGGRLFPYLTKGAKVYILGDLSLREYTGQDGLKHTGLNCFVREIELCGGKTEPQEDNRKF